MLRSKFPSCVYLYNVVLFSIPNYSPGIKISENAALGKKEIAWELPERGTTSKLLILQTRLPYLWPGRVDTQVLSQVSKHPIMLTGRLAVHSLYQMPIYLSSIY